MEQDLLEAIKRDDAAAIKAASLASHAANKTWDDRVAFLQEAAREIGNYGALACLQELVGKSGPQWYAPYLESENYFNIAFVRAAANGHENILTAILQDYHFTPKTEVLSWAMYRAEQSDPAYADRLFEILSAQSVGTDQIQIALNRKNDIKNLATAAINGDTGTVLSALDTDFVKRDPNILLEILNTSINHGQNDVAITVLNHGSVHPYYFARTLQTAVMAENADMIADIVDRIKVSPFFTPPSEEQFPSLAHYFSSVGRSQIYTDAFKTAIRERKNTAFDALYANPATHALGVVGALISFSSKEGNIHASAALLSGDKIDNYDRTNAMLFSRDGAFLKELATLPGVFEGALEKGRIFKTKDMDLLQTIISILPADYKDYEPLMNAIDQDLMYPSPENPKAYILLKVLQDHRPAYIDGDDLTADHGLYAECIKIIMSRAAFKERQDILQAYLDNQIPWANTIKEEAFISAVFYGKESVIDQLKPTVDPEFIGKNYKRFLGNGSGADSEVYKHFDAVVEAGVRDQNDLAHFYTNLPRRNARGANLKGLDFIEDGSILNGALYEALLCDRLDLQTEFLARGASPDVIPLFKAVQNNRWQEMPDLMPKVANPWIVNAVVRDATLHKDCPEIVMYLCMKHKDQLKLEAINPALASALASYLSKAPAASHEEGSLAAEAQAVFDGRKRHRSAIAMLIDAGGTLNEKSLGSILTSKDQYLLRDLNFALIHYPPHQIISALTAEFS